MPIFNGAVEIGLRALAVLTEGFPTAYSLHRLIAFDYLVVHSDDVPDGPPGLHPQTPHRGEELLVRRGVLQDGLLLYHSRGLIDRRYTPEGVRFAATEYSGAFMDSLDARYVFDLRDRANWLLSRFGAWSDDALTGFVVQHVGEWGAEFSNESVLWLEA